MRTRHLAAWALLSAGISLFPQAIEKRQLTWNDFKGTPEVKSPFEAYTYWSVYYTYDSPREDQGGIRFTFRIRNQLDSRSWVKPGVLTKPYQGDLLAHEQGHYNLGLLCALLFSRAVSNHRFTSNHRAETAQIFSEVLGQVRSLERSYDQETQHMKNRAKQREWDEKIALKLDGLWPSH